MSSTAAGVEHDSPGHPHLIEGPFELLGTSWRPIPVEHGDVAVFGYRVGGLVYITDFSRLPDSPWGCRRRRRTGDRRLARQPHPMHQTVPQALELVPESNRAGLVYTHRPRSPHEETNERLVRLGFPRCNSPTMA